MMDTVSSTLSVSDKVYTYQEYSVYSSLSLNSDKYTEEQKQYTRLNIHRLKRNETTVKLDEKNCPGFSSISRNMVWLVIAEPWCGDGAQILPVLHKIAAASKGKIELQIILRDTNPEIMDLFLTNGTRSIPKLVSLDKETGLVLWTWGPRPHTLSEMVDNFKKNTPGYTHTDLITMVHKWYTQDKGRSIISELLNIVSAPVPIT